jgi:hypothetical protein
MKANAALFGLFFLCSGAGQAQTQDPAEVMDAPAEDKGETDATKPEDAQLENTSSDDGLHWPLILVKGGLGMPLLVNGRLEVFFVPEWSAELGGSWGLIPNGIITGVNYRPHWMCLGCQGPLRLGLGLGLEHALFAFNEDFTPFGPEGMLVLKPGVYSAWNVFSRVGFYAAAHLGAGIAWGFPPGLEPAILILLETGFAF